MLVNDVCSAATAAGLHLYETLFLSFVFSPVSQLSNADCRTRPDPLEIGIQAFMGHMKIADYIHT